MTELDTNGRANGADQLWLLEREDKLPCDRAVWFFLGISTEQALIMGLSEIVLISRSAV